jgi:hypothetical protein
MDGRRAHILKGIRRRSFSPLTPLRIERLQHALTLFEVAQAARMKSYRVSLIERGLEDGTPEELRSLREAIERLVCERRGEPA